LLNPPFLAARHDWIERGIHEQLGLLTGMLLTEVPPELKAPEIPRQSRFAAALRSHQHQR